jgi:hypothetical protein
VTITFETWADMTDRSRGAAFEMVRRFFGRGAALARALPVAESRVRLIFIGCIDIPASPRTDGGRAGRNARRNPNLTHARGIESDYPRKNCGLPSRSLRGVAGLYVGNLHPVDRLQPYSRCF